MIHQRIQNSKEGQIKIKREVNGGIEHHQKLPKNRDHEKLKEIIRNEARLQSRPQINILAC